MPSQAITQYLNRYAEPDIHALVSLESNQNYDRCLVIPCFQETPEFAERLLGGPLTEQNGLVIVVINQSHEPIDPMNQALIKYFDKFDLLWQNHHLKLFQARGANTHWLVVNRTHPPLVLPPKQGVGLARKIGCDLAVALAARNMISSTWLHSTDADAHLPADYFDALLNHGDEQLHKFSAAVYDFAHIRAASTESDWRATQLYEQALRYYVAGLHWAGSPYAQQTIGSLMAFPIKAYCQVRGFPKRSAGEDFYLLNKLTKLGPVINPKAQVHIEARASNRVPFGTGPAVKAIATMTDPENEYCYYAPAIFADLKAWLETIPTVWRALQSGVDPLTNLPSTLRDALTEAGIDDLWSHLRQQTKDDQACQRAVHIWFDAFQTLKLIRRLQAKAYPALPLQQCIRDAPFLC